MFTIRFENHVSDEMCPEMLRKVRNADRYTVSRVSDAIEVKLFNGEGACEGSEFVNRSPQGAAVSGERLVHSTERNGDAPEPLQWDCAYVMNEQGATVDKIYA